MATWVKNRIDIWGPDTETVVEHLKAMVLDATDTVDVTFEVNAGKNRASGWFQTAWSIPTEVIDNFFWDVMANRWRANVKWGCRTEGTPKTVTYRLDMLEWVAAEEVAEGMRKCVVGF